MIQRNIIIIFSLILVGLVCFVSNDVVIHYLEVASGFLIQKKVMVLSFILPIPIVVICEHFYPVDPHQKILSTALVQDIIWTVSVKFIGIIALVAYIHMLENFYTQYMNFLSWTLFDHAPEIITVILGLLLVDFLEWFHHFVRHKVPWFWHFHVIHHSQKHMNMFTDTRYHFLEYFIAKTIMTFPLLIIGLNVTSIIYIVLIKVGWSKIYHSNIRTNMGPLKYIFVTPQSHRIHHSKKLEHADKNFGVFFSIWDYMFKTQYKGYDEYPDTGVENKRYPQDESNFGINLIVTPIKQTLFPFFEIARSVKGKAGALE